MSDHGNNDKDEVESIKGKSRSNSIATSDEGSVCSYLVFILQRGSHDPRYQRDHGDHTDT